MEIKGEGYRVAYDPATATITCQGSLRLNGTDGYAPIVELFNAILERRPATITLDLKDLQFLNSSGIYVLSKFVIRVRDGDDSSLMIVGTKNSPWQSKSLQNLKKLMPSMTLEVT